MFSLLCLGTFVPYHLQNSQSQSASLWNAFVTCKEQGQQLCLIIQKKDIVWKLKLDMLSIKCDDYFYSRTKLNKMPYWSELNFNLLRLARANFCPATFEWKGLHGQQPIQGRWLKKMSINYFFLQEKFLLYMPTKSWSARSSWELNY